MAAPRMIFFNIGWMEQYDGPKKDDKTKGGHGYLKTHDFGAESHNFSRVGTKVYGYRPGGRGPDIGNLGAAREDASINDVTSGLRVTRRSEKA